MNDLIGKLFLCIRTFHDYTIDKGDIILVLRPRLPADGVYSVISFPKNYKDVVHEQYINKHHEGFNTEYFREIL